MVCERGDVFWIVECNVIGYARWVNKFFVNVVIVYVCG